jgi:ABC-2 type transport system permease protein
MSALLAAEALKLRTTRLSWIVAGIAVPLSGLIGYAMVQISADQGEHLSLNAVAAAPAQTMWFLGIVVALVASAGEFQHRTIRTTLLASPRRTPVLIAKSIVAAAHGALLVILGGTTAAATAWVTSVLLSESLGGSGGPTWPQALATVVLGALWSVLATGLGILTRSIAVAVGVVLLWRFVGEGVLPVVTGVEGISRWLPMGLAQSIVEGTAPIGAGVVLAGYVVAICGLAALVFLRRDPT